MNELFDTAIKLLVLIVATCIAIRLAYDTVRPALPILGLLIVVIAIARFWRWHHDRW